MNKETALGIGLSLGVAIGAGIDNMGAGICIGLFVGVLYFNYINDEDERS